MTGKQFLLVLVALAVLVAAGLALQSRKQASYQAPDTRVGQRLVEGFKVDDVVTIDIVEPKATVTLVRGERGWTVKERGDYPADLEPIRDLLLKLHEIKVVQAEGLSDAIKPRLQLAAPDAGAKPEETGTLVELKGRDGKAVAKLVLGKKTVKEMKMPGLPLDGVPSGRYVWVAADPQRVNVVNEAFGNVLAKPEQWLAKELMRFERPKSITTFGPDGKENWSVAKDKEDAEWKLAGPGPLDLQKAYDASSALYALQIADAAPGVSDADAGLDNPTTVRAATFEGWTYELKIGKPAPDNRYYVRSSVTGAVPEARKAPGDEKAEDKEKADKAFADQKEALTAKLAREQAVAGRTVLVAKTAVDPLLRDRRELIKVDKPKDAKGAKGAKK
jgi:Domain of unknown function (DUF4340)